MFYLNFATNQFNSAKILWFVCDVGAFKSPWQAEINARHADEVSLIFFLLQCFSLWSQGLSWMQKHDKIWFHEHAFMFFCQSLCFPTSAYADSWQRKGLRMLTQDHEEKWTFIIKVCEFISPSVSSSYIISGIKIFICHRQQKFDVPRPSALFSNTSAILIWPCSYSMFLTKKM